MISMSLARRLRSAGLRWHPASGDAFSIDSGEFESEVFTVSDMTVEPHEFDTGTILGFNGTTEWALDSVAIENAVWLPREDQLREILGGTFRTLSRSDDGYRVETERDGRTSSFDAPDAASAYAVAVLALIAEAAQPVGD
ncbi:MAG TPA: hypothetical protein VN133_00050 [Humibacter sp.]|jgi:hypothetical protein|nr:hypothetical protein [Humibacter sp.]